MRMKAISLLKKDLKAIAPAEWFLISRKNRKKIRKFTNQTHYRGSRYRGISVNGNKWQLFVFVKNKKYYVGQLSTEHEAAELYDKINIIHNGPEANTNLAYTKEQVQAIIDLYSECC